MLNNLPLAVISCPTGKFIYVGRIPIGLCSSREPTISDIMAGRVARDGRVYSSLIFDTEKQAVKNAEEQGFAVSLPIKEGAHE